MPIPNPLAKYRYFKTGIDLQWEACHADTANHSTYGMLECEIQAMEAWKAEMDSLYFTLLESLDPEPKELLQQSQEAWEQYFHAEAEFSTRFYLDLDGTMWHIEMLSRQREFYRQRALALGAYLGNNFSEPTLNLSINLSLHLHLKLNHR